MSSAENECARMMAASAICLDRHDIEGFLAILDEGAVLEGRGRKHVGREAIRQALQGRDPKRLSRHLLSLPHIVITGSEGTGISYYTLYAARAAEQPPKVGGPVAIGEFQQTYRETREGWRVVHHRSVRVFDGEEER